MRGRPGSYSSQSGGLFARGSVSLAGDCGLYSGGDGVGSLGRRLMMKTGFGDNTVGDGGDEAISCMTTSSSLGSSSTLKSYT